MKLYKNLCEAVVRSLLEVFTENRYADKVIERTMKSNRKWGGRDRRFIAETTYDMIRWWRLICDASKIKEVNDEKTIWKLFGAWCVLNNWGLPEWHEVKEINEKNILMSNEKLQRVRKVRESVPDWIDELCVGELGEKTWEREIGALNEQARVVLRVNSLKATRNQLQRLFEEQEVETEAPAGFPDALVLKWRQNVFRLPQFKEGKFEVQDASSQLVAPFLQVKDGMRVIDACAGAGGKTLHLAALMNNRGRIIAMDAEQWKLDELKKRARRAGAGNIETRVADSSKVIKRMENSADRLLLDVPCSGLGVLRRNPDAKWKLSPEFIEKVKSEQQKILSSYSAMLKKGGIMVYSTCSILPSENEKQIDRFLSEQTGRFELIGQKTILPSNGFDGFFMASLKKV